MCSFKREHGFPCIPFRNGPSFLTLLGAVAFLIRNIFKKVLLAQTLAEDSTGEKTVTAKYTNWYGEILFRLISAEEICFSPELRSFVSLRKTSFDAEEYTDPKEIRALVELIGNFESILIFMI